MSTAHCEACGFDLPLSLFYLRLDHEGIKHPGAICRSCTRKRPVSADRVYVHPPGTVRKCRGCGETKPHDEFAWNHCARNGNRWYRASRCKGCACWKTKRCLTAKHGDRGYHAQTLKRLYGLSLAEFDAMLAAQGGVCLICGGTETTPKRKGGKIRPMCVDHDHTTGAVRGILCATCNNGLGCFKDDPVRVQSALDYLKRHSTQVFGTQHTV